MFRKNFFIIKTRRFWNYGTKGVENIQNGVENNVISLSSIICPLFCYYLVCL